MLSGIQSAATLSANAAISANATRSANATNDPREAIGQAKAPGDPSLKEAFDSFVGKTFYDQMFKAMRSTLNKPAYMHGGKAEEIFQKQFDQVLIDRMSDANAGGFSGTMFEQFQANLRPQR